MLEVRRVAASVTDSIPISSSWVLPRRLSWKGTSKCSIGLCEKQRCERRGCGIAPQPYGKPPSHADRCGRASGVDQLHICQSEIVINGRFLESFAHDRISFIEKSLNRPGLFVVADLPPYQRSRTAILSDPKTLRGIEPPILS